MCWAFNVVPSELPKLYWRYTLKDLETRLQLTYSWEMTKIYQEFETLAVIISKALGGGKSSSKPALIENEQQLVQAFANMFGKGSVKYG